MVKIGFICEGFTEFIFLQSETFNQLLAKLNLELVRVINSEGCGNLLPHNISGYITILENLKTDKILILTDLDRDLCITQTKERISAREQDLVIVSAKQIESWFLACNTAMRTLLDNPEFNFETPELEHNPYSTINSLFIAKSGKGVGGKIRLITKLIEMGLDVNEAAAHPQCPSAKYFVEKLTLIGKEI